MSSPAYKLGDSILGEIPVTLGLGYRIPALYVGLYINYSPGFAPSTGCTNEVSCKIGEVRIGLEGQYHFRPTRKVDPWVGLGIDYALLGAMQTINQPAFAPSITDKSSFSGFDFVNFEVGADYKISRDIGIGPYVGFALGEYSSFSASSSLTSATSQSQSIDGVPTSLHEWFTIGVRGVFDIPLSVFGPSPKPSGNLSAQASTAATPAPDPAPPPATPTATPASVPAAPATPTPTPAPAPAPAPVPAPVPAPTPAPVVRAVSPSAPLAPTPPVSPIAPVAPGVWPANAPSGDRSQCTLLCSDRGVALAQSETNRVGAALTRHLSGLRGCAVATNTTKRTVPISVKFDATGSSAISVNLRANTDDMRTCVSRFPAAPRISGPPNASWSCEDFCQ